MGKAMALEVFSEELEGKRSIMRSRSVGASSHETSYALAFKRLLLALFITGTFVTAGTVTLVLGSTGRSITILEAVAIAEVQLNDVWPHHSKRSPADQTTIYYTNTAALSFG